MEDIVMLMMSLGQKYPVVMTIFSIIGILRAIFKPLMSLIEALVAATKTKSDDERLEKAKQSKIYKAIVWLIDYATSIKIDKVKKADEQKAA